MRSRLQHAATCVAARVACEWRFRPEISVSVTPLVCSVLPSGRGAQLAERGLQERHRRAPGVVEDHLFYRAEGGFQGQRGARQEDQEVPPRGARPALPIRCLSRAVHGTQPLCGLPRAPQHWRCICAKCRYRLPRMASGAISSADDRGILDSCAGCALRKDLAGTWSPPSDLGRTARLRQRQLAMPSGQGSDTGGFGLPQRANRELPAGQTIHMLVTQS